MKNIPDTFTAFRIHNDANGYRAGVESISLDDLSEGEVTIEVAYSSVNYKDALAGTGKGKILKSYPLAGGIDVSGIVVESSDGRFNAGDEVIVTGCELSESRDGGYSQYLRLDANSVVPLPAGLTMREAMALGTAGFTAALCLYRMQANGQKPEDGPIVVTGASGGVGSIAINILSSAGYDPHAITGKVSQFNYLEELGATSCISRHDLHWGQRPLEKAVWAGCIDNVGGDMLAGITRVIKLWGNIASCGMAGGIGLQTTTMPFILRGVSLLGISSANCPYDIRLTIWDRLAKEWKPPHLDLICNKEIGLDGLMDTFNTMLAGESLGRTVVNIGDN
ncbi:MAG: acrylyl-CoA reductase (NADPH) [Lysobacterales bacterium]|jgi:acrylyl-CoA reductase (NADPH)